MKKYRFVISLITESYYLREQAAVATKMAQRMGSEVQVLYANSDPVLQSQQLLQIIQSRSAPRPDAILVEPITQLGLPRVAEAAVAAGIAWVVNNGKVDYLARLRKGKVPVFSINQAQKEAGIMQAKQIAAVLPAGGSVLHIQGPASSPVAVERAEGTMSTIGHNVQLKTIRSQWHSESAYQAVSSWLRLSIARAGSFDLVACQSNDLSLGARKAFQEHTQGAERERWMKLPWLGVGLLSQSKPLVDQGNLTAAVLTPNTMDRALELLVRALETGVQPPERTVLDVSSYPAVEELVTKQATTLGGDRSLRAEAGG
jgi:ABC-type sugar transport system substrate-binding protein